jgi:hypothetical protein
MRMDADGVFFNPVHGVRVRMPPKKKPVERLAGHHSRRRCQVHPNFAVQYGH